MVTPQDLILAAQKEVICINAEEAAELTKQEGVLIIDVREPQEHQDAALPGAVNIPRGVLEYKISGLCDDKECTILVHCAGGGRASLAAKTLKTLGYENVHAILAKFSELESAMSK